MNTLTGVVGGTVVGVGADIGMQAAFGNSICKSYGNQNPYKDCMNDCESYDTDREKKGCIMQMGCLDKDSNGNPIYENKSLKDECLANLMKSTNAGGQIDYEGLKYTLGKEVATELAEEIGMNLLKKKYGPQIAKRVNNHILTKIAKQTVSGIKTIGGKIAVKSGLKVAGTTVGKVAVTTGANVAAKTGANVAAKTGAKTGAKVAVTTAATTGTQTGAKTGIFAVFLRAGFVVATKVAMVTLAGAGAIFSIMDGMAIMLAFWDPNGWERTVTKDEIDQNRTRFLDKHTTYYDNKPVFSEKFKNEKDYAYMIYIAFEELCEEDPTNVELKAGYEQAKKEFEEIKQLYFNSQWKSSERPWIHGGPSIYPSIALPEYPFNSMDGDYIDEKTEATYNNLMMQYLKDNNLVASTKELILDEERLQRVKLEKEIAEELKKNILIPKVIPKNKKELNNIKKSIEKDVKLSVKIDDGILLLKKRINELKNTNKPGKAEELISKLDELTGNKKMIDDNIDMKKGSIDNIKQSRTSKIVKQNIKQYQNNNSIILLGVFIVIIFIILIYYFVIRKTPLQPIQMHSQI